MKLEQQVVDHDHSASGKGGALSSPTINGEIQDHLTLASTKQLRLKNSADEVALRCTGTDTLQVSNYLATVNLPISCTNIGCSAITAAGAITSAGDSFFKQKITTYVGDGNATQAITGWGFAPKLVIFYEQNGSIWYLFLDNKCVQVDTGGGFTTEVNELLDADGVTVALADDLNDNATTYYVWAFG